MKTIELKVGFLTPAFLGNASQAGQWRTPPFKALLRQWWRVAYAAEKNFAVDVAEMRRNEARLFGTAADGASNRSLVRLRLSHWDPGKMHRWERLATVNHPEVQRAVDSGLYLGFGPVILPRGQNQPSLKAGAAIQPGERAVLGIAYPEDEEANLVTALTLMDKFGTAGGRSRNGWGSFALEPAGDGALPVGIPALRDWQEALTLDWPHGIGRDERGPLVWQTQPMADWKTLMRELAVVKIGLRTRFKFPQASTPHDGPLDRHWLSYPVARHDVKGWRNRRLPNSLRFKAWAMADGRLTGVVFHVPCQPPPPFRPDRETLHRVWKQVHGHLDESTLGRVSA